MVTHAYFATYYFLIVNFLRVTRCLSVDFSVREDTNLLNTDPLLNNLSPLSQKIGYTFAHNLVLEVIY